MRKNKKAQLKIQEMAFMLVAVVLFFILVGLFVLTLVYQNIYKEATLIAESKTLSAITNLADSPEFNCRVAKSNCVDGDKLIALTYKGDVYQKYWPFTSLRVVRSDAFEKSYDEMVKCSFSNYQTCTYQGGVAYVDCGRASINFFLSPTMGAMEHLPPKGNANPPALAIKEVAPGEVIKISNLKGVIDYQGGTTINCRKTARDRGYGWIKGAFYHPDANIRYSEYDLVDFELGKRAPSEPGIESYRLFFYVKEAGKYIHNYEDNIGGCSFTILPEEATGECTTLVEDAKVCEPECDVFEVYDKKIENERTISSFVALCRKEYENGKVYDRCEIAKLVAGTEIKSAGESAESVKEEENQTIEKEGALKPLE